MRATTLTLVALCACTIKDIDYSGKGCPCPAGYQCDVLSNTCTKDNVPDDANDDRRDATDAMPPPGVSCFQNPRTKLIYSSVGFSDFPIGWLGASGQWSSMGGEVQQTNSANSLAWISHAVPTTGGAANYRIVATMRWLDGQVDSGVGIGFRISGGMGNQTMYLCSYSPGQQELKLAYSQGGVTVGMATESLVIGDPTKQFTMEINATGMVQSCCIRGYDTVQLSSPNSMLPSGNPGVITRDSSGAFSAFYAYE